MNCAVGFYSSMIGASNATEGCEICAVGSWSNGINATQCAPMTCASGQKSTIAGATNSIEGCVDCIAGT